MNRQTKQDIRIAGGLILICMLTVGLIMAFILLGSKTIGACELSCSNKLEISQEDRLNARLGTYRNGTMTTYGGIKVRVSLEVEQANSYSIDNNFNKTQGSFNEY